ncbi:protein of unknown function [Cardinium endosymbiont cEper1 of Encarsia pergandiella]|nr:protein of unknown function [Cardinium endosymbiont cEper1 of Encarsia pergandiella]
MNGLITHYEDITKLAKVLYKFFIKRFRIGTSFNPKGVRSSTHTPHH